MNIENPQAKELFQKFKDRMAKTIAVLQSDYNSLRIGRANPHLLDKISVDYYGTKTPLNQVGNISVVDARCITIAPWEASMLKVIEKAILEANIGLTPSNDGKVVRLVFPEMTEERRKETAKQVKKIAEDSKVALRNIRREVIDGAKKLKNDKIISEDEYTTYEKEFEKIFSAQVVVIDNLAKDKEKEVMSV